MNPSQLNISEDFPSITDSEQSVNTFETQRSDNVSSVSSLGLEQHAQEGNPVEPIPALQNEERLCIHPEHPSPFDRVEDTVGFTPEIIIEDFNPVPAKTI